MYRSFGFEVPFGSEFRLLKTWDPELRLIAMVGEHSAAVKPHRRRADWSEIGKDFVGISSDNAGENPAGRKPKVSCVKFDLRRVSRSLRRGRKA